MTVKCTNCWQPFELAVEQPPVTETVFCPGCEQFREQLTRLRVAQKKFRAGQAGKRVKPPRGGHSFKEQCLRYGKSLERTQQLSGQDAALPPQDRNDAE